MVEWSGVGFGVLELQCALVVHCNVCLSSRAAVVLWMGLMFVQQVPQLCYTHTHPGSRPTLPSDKDYEASTDPPLISSYSCYEVWVGWQCSHLLPC